MFFRVGPAPDSGHELRRFLLKVQSVIKIIDFLIWTGPRLRPWAPKLVFCIRKLLQFNDFVSDWSLTPAVRSETYILHSLFFLFNLLFFRFGPVPDNDGVNVMRYICMFIVNPSQIPSRVQ